MYGVRKTDTITADYVNTWQLLMDNDQIRWSEDFFTLSKEYATGIRSAMFTKGSDEDIVLSGCKTQMSRMKYVKRKITGKEGGFNDDMAVVLMMSAYWSKAVENRDAKCYEPYRNLVWVDTPNPNNQAFSLDLQKYKEANQRNNYNKNKKDASKITPDKVQRNKRIGEELKKKHMSKYKRQRKDPAVAKDRDDGGDGGGGRDNNDITKYFIEDITNNNIFSK